MYLACFKFAVSLQHCTPHVIVHWVYVHTANSDAIGFHFFVMKPGQLARSKFCAYLRDVARCVVTRCLAGK